jgi:DoxX-like family
MNTRYVETADTVMPALAAAAPVSRPAIWLRRVLSGFMIVFLLVDGANKLMPWPVVAETMDRMGCGSSGSMARGLGAIGLFCNLLYAIPANSILGAILTAGYLCGVMASQLRIGSPQFSHILLGFHFGVTIWAGLWLRYAGLRALSTPGS